MFNCRSRLICSVVSYYICQMKSFWLQIQRTNVQTKRKCSFSKTSGSLFLNKETAIWCVKERVYLATYCMRVKGPKPSTFNCSFLHSKSGCDDKNKGRQTSWGRRQSVRQTWMRRLPQVSNIWTALIPRRALDPPHTPSQKWTGNPGRRETGNKLAVLLLCTSLGPDLLDAPQI